ncbi:hypothetical protein [Flavobacterium eburneipallidum]|uniref:hypothetical protein n=1 Tax=Flavobacterium eburneipallidum TaxID=3003263 RepID=UPI0022ABEE30|nr:hypothetical protein [Flavobacterium eburneipallidum]
MILEHVILLTNKLQNGEYDSDYFCGDIVLDEADINSITELVNTNLIEVYTQQSDFIEIPQLKEHIRKLIKLEIATGSIPNYFKSLNDFIQGNKFENKLEDFYIADISYRNNVDSNIKIDLYKQNLTLISFLRKLTDSEKKKNMTLELLFYKSGLGTDLVIDYKLEDLKTINITELQIIQSQFENSGSGEDKKQLFINELINFINSCGKSYITVAHAWDTLIVNYKKSVLLFIAGFSFEKIKISSNEHFQKLADKISESIGKASTYIFGVPVGYILLLNGMDFTGFAIGKNLILLILGTIFFILIWSVLFANIKESINLIEAEIDDFITKIENVIALEDIKNKLLSLKTNDLTKQRKKLLLVRILSSIIYVLLIIVYAYVFIDISVFYL